MKHIVLRKLSLVLEKTMRAKNISPKELALLSKIGYSSLIPILNGSRDFGVTKFIAIANALGVSADTLLSELLVTKNSSVSGGDTSLQSQQRPKYLVVFVSFVLVTYCLVCDVKTQTKKNMLFQFALGVGQKPNEFMDTLISSVQTVIKKNYNEEVSNREIAIYASVPQYEAVTTRTKIQELGEELFAKFILESDAISSYRAIFGNKSGVLVIINDGNSIVYSSDNGNKIIQLQGYGFPISDVAGNYWVGCEAVKYVVNVKESLEPSSILSDRILALFNDDVYFLADSVLRTPSITYTKVSAVVRELIAEDAKSQEIIRNSAKLLLNRIQVIDNKIKSKLPIALAGDLANVYRAYFPKERLINLKDKMSNLLLNYGMAVLQKVSLPNRSK